MKVNLQKLTELEIKYKESMLATDTIQRMMGIVLEKTYGVNGLIDTASNPAYLMAFSTLQEFGVIEN
jgi:hypothetical protein